MVAALAPARPALRAAGGWERSHTRAPCILSAFVCVISPTLLLPAEGRRRAGACLRPSPLCASLCPLWLCVECRDAANAARGQFANLTSRFPYKLLTGNGRSRTTRCRHGDLRQEPGTQERLRKVR